MDRKIPLQNFNYRSRLMIATLHSAAALAGWFRGTMCRDYKKAVVE
jgi:hypothetical protein